MTSFIKICVFDALKIKVLYLFFSKK